MPIDKKTQVNASVVLEEKTYERLKKVAKMEKRSVSAQVGYLIEQFLRERKGQNDDERRGPKSL